MGIIPSATTIKKLLTHPEYSVLMTINRLQEGGIKGRQVSDWENIGSVRGVISRAGGNTDAAARPDDDFGQLDRNMTHIIALPHDSPEVAPNDQLVTGGRIYWIRKVIDPSGLRLFIRVLAEERQG